MIFLLANIQTYACKLSGDGSAHGIFRFFVVVYRDE